MGVRQVTIGIAMIEDERTRQQAVEGYDDVHDDAHDNSELIAAAMAYLTASVKPPSSVPDGMPEEMRPFLEPLLEGMASAAEAAPALMWPFEKESFSPSDDILRNLVRAGAFIAAEIDRRVRAEGWRG